MWSYHGAKTRIINKYPGPVHGLIIEPFAGSARYALKYWDRDIVLIDRYPVITEIWQWLKQCTADDILELPRIVKKGQTIDDFKFSCGAAKNLFGFIITKGVEKPRKSATRWTMEGGLRPTYINYTIKRIAENVHKVKNWDIRCGNYFDVDNERATWFIDPPYKIGGDSYVWNNKKINYIDLAAWCRSRDGQVIVCEGEGATWLPFEVLIRHRVKQGYYTDVLYYQENNLPALWSANQLSLF